MSFSTEWTLDTTADPVTLTLRTPGGDVVYESTSFNPIGGNVFTLASKPTLCDVAPCVCVGPVCEAYAPSELCCPTGLCCDEIVPQAVITDIQLSLTNPSGTTAQIFPPTTTTPISGCFTYPIPLTLSERAAAPSAFLYTNCGSSSLACQDGACVPIQIGQQQLAIDIEIQCGGLATAIIESEYNGPLTPSGNCLEQHIFSAGTLSECPAVGDVLVFQHTVSYPPGSPGATNCSWSGTGSITVEFI